MSDDDDMPESKSKRQLVSRHGIDQSDSLKDFHYVKMKKVSAFQFNENLNTITVWDAHLRKMEVANSGGDGMSKEELRNAIENVYRTIPTLSYHNVRQFLGDLTELEEEHKNAPPPPSGFVVLLLMPASKASDFVDQMAEVYPNWVKEFGEKRARWIWWSQGLQAVVGHWINRGLDLFGKLWPSILRKPSND
ncbi:hypothetical protein [Rhizobium leguminosarum]|uniref:hypothetical protein n=1 Tax=Rhizobium leguminosarum TaxID=384 RepID=UPI003F9B614E